MADGSRELIVVLTKDGGKKTHADWSAFAVEEDGHLQIFAAGSSLRAVYAPGYWLCVSVDATRSDEYR